MAKNFEKVNPYHKYQAFSFEKMLGENYKNSDQFDLTIKKLIDLGNNHFGLL